VGTLFNAGGYMKKINWKKVKAIAIKARDSVMILWPVIKGVLQLWKR
jgi:hypothetical protein